eukprot:768032-Hanusia_phi.AAC.4
MLSLVAACQVATEGNSATGTLIGFDNKEGHRQGGIDGLASWPGPGHAAARTHGGPALLSLEG